MSGFEAYGRFDDAGREFIITDPFPPTTWINYLSNGRFCSIISQKGGGFSFFESAAELRLTRYRQTRSFPMDRPGHWVYLREADGTLWSPTFEPTRTNLDRWECHVGLGYTTFQASYRDLAITLTFFVPPEDQVLVWDLHFANRRKEAASILVVPYVEFSFQEMMEEVMSFHWCRMQLSFTYDESRGAIKYFYGPPYAKRRINTFLSASRRPDSFCCDRDAFMGCRGTEERPEEMVRGKLSCTQLPGGGHGCGALGFHLSIPAGGTDRLAVVLGCAETWPEVDAMIQKFQSLSVVDEGRRAVSRFYDDYLRAFQIVDLPDREMKRFVNIWNPYNCRHSFERARFVSAIHTGMGGGMQSRDSVQDAMSIAHLVPSWARERIAIVQRYQHPNGRYISTFDPKSKKEPVDDGTHVRCDNGVWQIFTTYAYLAETGDLSFLHERIPYYKGSEASLFEHLWMALRYIVENQGKHGLPLMFDQDWNDSLQLFKRPGCQTVMLAEQVVYACRLLAEMARLLERDDVVVWCEREAERLKTILNSDVVWDGAWYRRVIYADKEVHLGSAKRPEGKIYLNTQSWAVIAGVASPERARIAMGKCEELLAEPYGFRLLWPPYSGTPEPGDPLLGNGPGVSENAGVFNHANTWAIIAATVMGDGIKAFEWYARCLPPNVIAKVGIERYMNEPYCYSSHIIAPPDPRAGMALLSWLSGTTTWMYIAATQYILGIRPTLQGLLLDPCIPPTWSGFSVERRYRGSTYRIRIQNPRGVMKGIASITVDGKAISGAVLPLLPPGSSAEIQAVMG